MAAMASDLFANASLFTPPEPESLAKLDISDTVISELIMRLIYMHSRMVAHEIAAEVCLPFHNIVEPILNELKEHRLIEITKGEMASISYVYAITDEGRARAMRYFEQTTYVGPAPISVDAYTQIIAEQSLRQITVHADRLHESPSRGLRVFFSSSERPSIARACDSAILSPSAYNASSKSTNSLSWARNQGSILVRLWISSAVKPARKAWRI
jgi:hypothetical protein